MAFVRPEGKNKQVGMQSRNISNTVRTGESSTKCTVDTYIGIRDCPESVLHQRTGGTGEDMAAYMAVAHMYDAKRISGSAQPGQTQLLPERIKNTQTVGKYILLHLPECGGKSYQRDRHRIRTLGIEAESITIRSTGMTRKAAWQYVLCMERPYRRNQYQHRAANHTS